MPYATVSDVAIDFGDIPDSDIDKVETLLERAEARIRQAFPDLDDRMTDGRTQVVLVKQVESEMVTSVLQNPGGVRSVTESVGPFSRTTGYGSSYTANVDPGFGLLDLTKRHRLMLGGRGDQAGSFGPFLEVPAATEYLRPAVVVDGLRTVEGEWV